MASLDDLIYKELLVYNLRRIKRTGRIPQTGSFVTQTRSGSVKLKQHIELGENDVDLAIFDSTDYTKNVSFKVPDYLNVDEAVYVSFIPLTPQHPVLTIKFSDFSGNGLEASVVPDTEEVAIFDILGKNLTIKFDGVSPTTLEIDGIIYNVITPYRNPIGDLVFIIKNVQTDKIFHHTLVQQIFSPIS